MGGVKRNAGSETLRGEAPDADGAQENNRMLTPLQQSSVWRAFVAARYKSTRHSTKTLRAELLTEQY